MGDFNPEKYPLDPKIISTRNPPYVLDNFYEEDKNYAQFIFELLKKTTKINTKKIHAWTSPKYYNMWRISRTHSTFSNQSYEQIELVGDKLFNSLVSLYFSDKHPDVVNTEWLTKIQNKMHSAEFVMQIGYSMGIYKFILIEPDKWHLHTETPLSKRNMGITGVWYNENWKKLLTDMVEAFTGTLFKIVRQEEGNLIGVAYEVISQVIFPFIERIPFSMNIYDLVDQVTLLKESMDLMRRGLGLEANDKIDTRYDIKKSLIQDVMKYVNPDTQAEVTEFRWYVTTVQHGYPNNSTRYIVAISDWSTDNSYAKQQAAKNALKWWTMDGKYHPLVVDPNSKQVYENKNVTLYKPAYTVKPKPAHNEVSVWRHKNFT